MRHETPSGYSRPIVSSPPDAEGAAARLRVAFDLFEAGVTLMRQKIARERPDASQREVEELVCRWLRTRPGAEHGDAVGRRLDPPRREE